MLHVAERSQAHCFHFDFNSLSLSSFPVNECDEIILTGTWLLLIVSEKKRLWRRCFRASCRALMVTEESLLQCLLGKRACSMFPPSHRGAIKSPPPHAWDRGRESEWAACVTCGRAAIQAADEGSLSTLHWTTAAVHLELGWHCLLCPHGPAWAGLWLTGHGRVKGRLIEHADEREMSNKYCC